MKLADVSIERPVFATMMIFALIVLGLFSYMKLNIDMFPDVDIPYVTVTTVLRGAGPEQIETDVTKKIEDAVNPVAGVDHIQSTSQEGLSIVVIQFKLEIDGRTAAQEVREKVAAARANLPTEIEDPVITRFDPASLPILTLTVSGSRSGKAITTYTKDVIKKRLENVPGVGAVDLVGGDEREIEIAVDAAKLRAYNLSIEDVIASVGAANMEVPAGSLTNGPRQVLLRTMGKYTSMDEIRGVIVASPGGRIVHLSDVAAVSDGVKERTSLARVNGRAAVGLNIQKQSGSNTVQVADAIKAQIERMRKDLPADIEIDLARDNSTFIRDSVDDVIFDIAYGGLLAVIVVYLFLARFRPTAISAIALPTSIIASFIIMFALNFTLNVMSLMALSLAVGLLIDDAIVVIENIYRHMHAGATPTEAAKAATSEIGLAVMATTFTVVAVFVPVAFMSGIIGRFFYQFGITVAVAVLVSLFVAFTLTPMLASRWLREEDEELAPSGSLLRKALYYFNHFFQILSARYQRAIAWSLRHRAVVIAVALAVFIASLAMSRLLSSAFFPTSDQSEFTIGVNASPGSSLEQTADICARIEQVLGQRPEVTTMLTTIGAGNDPVTKGNVLVKLVKKNRRAKGIERIMGEVRRNLAEVAGANFSIMVSQGPGGGTKPVIMSVRGDDLVTLEQLAGQVESIVRTTPGAVDVENSLETSKPEMRIRIDREKASDLGISVGQIATGIRSMVDGAVATQFTDGGEQYDVRVRMAKEDRTSLESIRDLTIKSTKDGPNQSKILVPVTDVATIGGGSGPSKINRFDRQKEIRIDANTSTRQLGDVLGDILARTARMTLPAGYSVGVTGSGEQQAQSFVNIFIALALAVVFVYIVLAAQFESFALPFSIMLALPMSLIGAVFALLVFGSALSVISLIGIIMLMGLVTKNGILLVDYANVLRDRGLERTEALVKAGATRLRPILMTTFAMIFGMMPVAFSVNEGSEFRSPMGQAVIGGLITSTLLTLFVVPVVYSLIDDLSFARMRAWVLRSLAAMRARLGQHPGAEIVPGPK
ncbi:MAG TPA: efflux RND transporter permease subunit [Bacteroidota bacterium]|nr:efflux RND transporter permease subunit [Bacteroidota bacterium]